MFILTKTDTCKEMQAALDNPNVALFYGPAERCFSAPLVEPGEIPAEVWRVYIESGHAPIGPLVNFCPWTGAVLPPSLSQTWAVAVDELHAPNHDVVPVFSENPENYKTLPDAYKTEEWWRKLGSPLSRQTSNPHAANYDVVDLCPPNDLEDWPISEYLEQDKLPSYAWPDPWNPFRSTDHPGHSRWPDIPAHHCEGCNRIWNEGEDMYAYFPHVREFGFRVLDPNKPVSHQPIEIVPVNNCFQCGTKLPPSVRPQWETRMRALGLDPTVPRTPFSDPLPDGLHGNGWWQEAQVYDPDWPHEFVPPFVPTPFDDDDDDKQVSEAINDNKTIRPVE